VDLFNFAAATRSALYECGCILRVGVESNVAIDNALLFGGRSVNKASLGFSHGNALE
jgi:hypothetical protein